VAINFKIYCNSPLSGLSCIWISLAHHLWHYFFHLWSLVQLLGHGLTVGSLCNISALPSGPKWKKLVTSFGWRNGDDVTKWRHNSFFGVRFRHNQLKKTTVWSNHVTLGQQYWRLRGAGSGNPPVLGDSWKFVTKIMHFRHVSAKIQPKNLKQDFDLGERRAPWLLGPWLRPWLQYFSLLFHRVSSISHYTTTMLYFIKVNFFVLKFIIFGLCF